MIPARYPNLGAPKRKKPATATKTKRIDAAFTVAHHTLKGMKCTEERIGRNLFLTTGRWIYVIAATKLIASGIAPEQARDLWIKEVGRSYLDV